MSTVKLNDRVRITETGEITTIAELNKQNRIDAKIIDNFYSSRTATGTTTKYFADLKGTDYGWEITKAGYQELTGQKINFKREKLITESGIEITMDAIKAFNNNSNILFNDNWNIANHLGTLAENQYLRLVSRYYGDSKVTYDTVKQYIKTKVQTA